MAKVEIVAERCKSCGYCVKFCPKQVLEIGTGVNSKGYEYVVPVLPGGLHRLRHLRPHVPGRGHRDLQVRGGRQYVTRIYEGLRGHRRGGRAGGLPVLCRLSHHPAE